MAEDWERSLVTVYFFTGLRRGEVIGLSWSTSSSTTIYLIVDQTVGDTEGRNRKLPAVRRKVQFGVRVRTELLAQRRRVELNSAYVFPNENGQPLNPHWLGQKLRPRIVERAGVELRPIGRTRHTYAALILQRGAPLAWLLRQMGYNPSNADSALLAIRHRVRILGPEF